jgi:response regulator RpfG family c-di-GMP phosphodiesterase
MTMPQMTGKRLVKEILDIRADMPIILCTGFHNKISEEKVRELGINAFVTKPFVMQNFALKVRKVLDECLSLSSKRTRKYAKAGLRSA